MAFDAFELSAFLGRPMQLLVFTCQNQVLRFANADRNIPIGANTYIGGQIEHSEIRETAERAKDKITIKLAYVRDPYADEFPSTQTLGDWFHPFPPGDPVMVTCLAGHYGDTDPPRVVWMGVVTQPDFTDTLLTLTCEPTNGFARSRGQGPRWQRSCWKVPYSTGLRGCGMDPDDFKAEGALTSVVGITLKAAAFAASTLSLAGGWVYWTNPANGLKVRRPILTHAGDTITIPYAEGGVAVGIVATALPTCPRTWEGCAARFPDPQNHYGGAYYKPINDPAEESMSWG